MLQFAGFPEFAGNLRTAFLELYDYLIAPTEMKIKAAAKAHPVAVTTCGTSPKR